MVTEVFKFSLVHHSHYGCLSMSVSVSELTVVTGVFSLVYYTILTTINVCLPFFFVRDETESFDLQLIKFNKKNLSQDMRALKTTYQIQCHQNKKKTLTTAAAIT